MRPNRIKQQPQTSGDYEALVNQSLVELEQVDAGGTWAVYSRLSRVLADEPAYSLEYQPDRAEKYAREKGAEKIALYKDEDYSGKNSKRPDLRHLIHDIKAGKISVVVIHRLDRLYRNLESLLRFVRLCKRHRVRLMSVEEKIDTDSSWGRIVLAVLGALAEAYIWQTSEYTRMAKMQRLKHGKANGLIPLGYCNGLCSVCRDPNGRGYCPRFGGSDLSETRGEIPVLHPIDRHSVFLTIVLYSRGWSFREIAAYINSHDFILPDGSVVHFRPKGQRTEGSLKNDKREFTRESVRIIVKSPFYAGLNPQYERPPLDMDDEDWTLSD